MHWIRIFYLRRLKDEDPQVRKTAVWLSEDYLKAQDEEIFTALQALKEDVSGDVRIQLVLSLRYSKLKEGKSTASGNQGTQC